VWLIIYTHTHTHTHRGPKNKNDRVNRIVVSQLPDVASQLQATKRVNELYLEGRQCREKGEDVRISRLWIWNVWGASQGKNLQDVSDPSEGIDRREVVRVALQMNRAKASHARRFNIFLVQYDRRR
jgi:hypothetical protein